MKRLAIWYQIVYDKGGQQVLTTFLCNKPLYKKLQIWIAHNVKCLTIFCCGTYSESLFKIYRTVSYTIVMKLTDEYEEEKTCLQQNIRIWHNL